MAILHSCPYSMRLTYDVFTYFDEEPTNEWMIKYQAKPLLYGRPFIQPKFLKRWNLPPGAFQFTDCMRECTFVLWLKKAINGYLKSWSSIEPPFTEISLFPGHLAPFEAQGIFLANNHFNPDGIDKPLPGTYLLQWQFGSDFFKIKSCEKEFAAPFVIQQWLTRSQLEHWIAELESELQTALDNAGVPWLLYK